MKKSIVILVALGLLSLSSLCMAYEVKVKVAGDGKNSATYQIVSMTPEATQTHVASVSSPAQKPGASK
jgi:hypothetical protein